MKHSKKGFLVVLLALFLFGGCFETVTPIKASVFGTSTQIHVVKKAGNNATKKKAKKSSKKLKKTKGKKTYHVKPSTKPCGKKYKKYIKSKYVKQYFMVRSYLEKLEKEGGGTLILSKGLYKIPATLNIPSNVTVILNDDVVVKKTRKVGKSKIYPTDILFQFVSTGKTAYRGKKKVKGYGASNHAKIIGKGSATIDLGYTKNAIGVQILHSKNSTVSHINFKNMYDGNFIKLGASKNIKITECHFSGYKKSSGTVKEAIRIEVPDAKTKMFQIAWSKNDKTVCDGVYMKHNVFDHLERAIGSVKYSSKRYQKKIQVIANTFTNMDDNAIDALNWKNATITWNTFDSIRWNESYTALWMAGMVNPTVTKNVFNHVRRPIRIATWKNIGYGAAYKVTYNKISAKNKKKLMDNTFQEVGEYYIRYNNKRPGYASDTKWRYIDKTANTFELKPDSKPYRHEFEYGDSYNWYNQYYFILRSYLEQLEEVGGGTITIYPGKYYISRILSVPSNVTIIFQDGAILQDGTKTGANEQNGNTSIFQLVEPSLSGTDGAHSDYDGVTNVTFSGTGTETAGGFDLAGINSGIGIILCHNQNIAITGLNFYNMNDGHFIELDASKNVKISKNLFSGAVGETSIKEAINIDRPDLNTGGFNHCWTSYDATPNQDVYITENSFKNLKRAIGSHKYTPGSWHDNIQILNNKITNMQVDAICMMNWSNPIVKGNWIDGVQDTVDSGITMRGVKNPRVTLNVFKNCNRCIDVQPGSNYDDSGYDITNNELDEEAIRLLLINYMQNVKEETVSVRLKETDQTVYYKIKDSYIK